MEDIILPPTEDQKILWVILDMGNGDLKGMVYPRFGKYVILPHSVARRTLEQWKNDQILWKNRKYDHTSSVGFNCAQGAFVIGQQARQMGGYYRMGHDKYTREHMGVLVKSMLYRLHPRSHKDVRLIVSHPSRMQSDNIKALVKSVYGQHKIELPDGARLTYDVKEVLLIEESVAAFNTFVLNTEGTPYVRGDKGFSGLQPGDEFINIDIGAYISYMGQGLVNEEGRVEMNPFSGRPIEYGILKVYDILDESIRQQSKKFPGLSTQVHLDHGTLSKAIRNQYITIKNKPYECKSEIQAAMTSLISELMPEFHGRFKGGTTANVIVVSGGGGDLAYEFLLKDKENPYGLIEHDFVYPAEEKREFMRVGALNGAAKGHITNLKYRNTDGTFRTKKTSW